MCVTGESWVFLETCNRRVCESLRFFREAHLKVPPQQGQGLRCWGQSPRAGGWGLEAQLVTQLEAFPMPPKCPPGSQFPAEKLLCLYRQVLEFCRVAPGGSEHGCFFPGCTTAEQRRS